MVVGRFCRFQGWRTRRFVDCVVSRKDSLMSDQPAAVWKCYRRLGLTEARPYVHGEDLTGVSISATAIAHLGE
jgi:hypothetical protein